MGIHGDRRYNNICSECYPAKKAYYAQALNDGKEARKATLQAAQTVAAHAAARGATVAGAAGAVREAAEQQKPKLAPSAFLDQCTANALNQIKSTTAQAKSAFRGVPSYVGAVVVVWDEASQLM